MMPPEPIQVHDDILPLVTVAVCTRDRAHQLDSCLTAVQRLTYPRLDVLLIDNVPITDAAKVLVENRFPHVRYRVEPRPGLDWARNRAVVEAEGDIIAFTDDDVVVDPGWVDALVRVFAEDPHIMAVTGLVAPYELETEAQILFEKYGGFGKGFKRKSCPLRKEGHLFQWSHLAAGDLGTGANMAFRRSVFDTIGLFDPALDTGTPTGGGGDLEMFFRVVQEGHALVYEPKAVVRHIHRREYHRLKTQIRSWGTAFMAYLTRSAMAYPKARPMIVCFALRWLVGRHLIRPLKQLLAGKSIPLDLVLAELTGSFAGVFAYHKALRRVKEIEAGFGPML